MLLPSLSTLPSDPALLVVMSQTQTLGGPLEMLPQSSAQVKNGGGPDDDGPSVLEVKMDGSYTFAGETEFRGKKHGDSDAYNFNFSAGDRADHCQSVAATGCRP